MARFEYGNKESWTRCAKRFNGQRFVELQGGTKLYCANQETAQALCDLINILVTVEETK